MALCSVVSGCGWRELRQPGRRRQCASSLASRLGGAPSRAAQGRASGGEQEGHLRDVQRVHMCSSSSRSCWPLRSHVSNAQHRVTAVEVEERHKLKLRLMKSLCGELLELAREARCRSSGI